MMCANREQPQPLDRLRDDRLHHPAQVQPADHAMDCSIGEKAANLGADVDDAGMRARADDDEPQIADLGHQHALVEQQRVGPPRGVGAGAAQMVDPAFFKGAHPRDLAAQIKMSIEQQARRRVVDDCGAQRRHFGRGGDPGRRHDGPAAEPDRALVEHAGIDVDRGLAALLADRGQGRRQRRHMVPVAVADCDGLDLAERHAEIGAVAEKDRPFRPGVEQEGMAHPARIRCQPAAEPQIGAQQRLARQHRGPGAHHIGELGNREQRLADISVADIVGNHIDHQRIERNQRNFRNADFCHGARPRALSRNVRC